MYSKEKPVKYPLWVDIFVAVTLLTLAGSLCYLVYSAVDLAKKDNGENNPTETASTSSQHPVP